MITAIALSAGTDAACANGTIVVVVAPNRASQEWDHQRTRSKVCRIPSCTPMLKWWDGAPNMRLSGVA
jgi:hypothetical protein